MQQIHQIIYDFYGSYFYSGQVTTLWYALISLVRIFAETAIIIAVFRVIAEIISTIVGGFRR